MTRKQRLASIKRSLYPGPCEKCGGTGWIRPGHKYGVCLCRIESVFRKVSNRDAKWLVRLVEKARLV